MPDEDRCCPKCGVGVSPGDLVCPDCGANTGDSTARKLLSVRLKPARVGVAVGIVWGGVVFKEAEGEQS